MSLTQNWPKTPKSSCSLLFKIPCMLEILFTKHFSLINGNFCELDGRTTEMSPIVMTCSLYSHHIVAWKYIKLWGEEVDHFVKKWLWASDLNEMIKSLVRNCERIIKLLCSGILTKVSFKFSNFLKPQQNYEPTGVKQTISSHFF